jgi:hypothetical protein
VTGLTFSPSFHPRAIEVMQLDEISQCKINSLTTAAQGQNEPPNHVRSGGGFRRERSCGMVS